jgi:hypothetical protein
MVYRGLYHFGVANQKGLAQDPVKYFAAPDHKDLGIIKQKRKNNIKLVIAPFPEKQRNTPEFFLSLNFPAYA